MGLMPQIGVHLQPVARNGEAWGVMRKKLHIAAAPIWHRGELAAIQRLLELHHRLRRQGEADQLHKEPLVIRLSDHLRKAAPDLPKDLRSGKELVSLWEALVAAVVHQKARKPAAKRAPKRTAVRGSVWGRPMRPIDILADRLLPLFDLTAPLLQQVAAAIGIAVTDLQTAERAIRKARKWQSEQEERYWGAEPLRRVRHSTKPAAKRVILSTKKGRKVTR